MWLSSLRFPATAPAEHVEEELHRKPELHDGVVDCGVHEAAGVLGVFVAGLALKEHVSERHVVVEVFLPRGEKNGNLSSVPTPAPSGTQALNTKIKYVEIPRIFSAYFLCGYT